MGMHSPVQEMLRQGSGGDGDRSESPKAKEVNSLLHRLRGEQFRHGQNLRKARSYLPSRTRGNAGPSLPFDLIYGSSSPRQPEESLDAIPSGSSGQPPAVSRQAAGPVPKSWLATQQSPAPRHNTADWRREALSIIFSLSSDTPKLDTTSASRVPPLLILCMRALLDYCGPGAEFAQEIVPFLTPHMRRQLLRYTAVHDPFGNGTLYALFEPEGHADGEIAIVGPQASVRGELFSVSAAAAEAPDAAWDAEGIGNKSGARQIMQSVTVLSAALSVPTLLTLPPSLTHLALLRLPTAVPIHRLPGKAPRLEVLDLSYNEWLNTTFVGEQKLLDLVAWSRWRHLAVLGCRESGVDEGALKRVNEGRWVDGVVVKIII